MTGPGADRSGQIVRSWLAGGVGSPSPDVLEVALVRTRSVRQRPALLARASGTSDGTIPGGAMGPLSARAVLAAVVVIAGIVLGSWRWSALVGAPTRYDLPSSLTVGPPAPSGSATTSPPPSTPPGANARGSTPSDPTSRASEPPQTVASDYFIVTFPESWSASGGQTGVFLRKPVLFSPSVDIVWVPGGGVTRVSRGAEASTFDVPSGTLSELARVIERGSGAASSARHDVTVDGADAIWYETPQATIVGPLAAIAVVPRSRGTIVVTLHLGLDGKPDLGFFRDLLVGLRLR